MPPAAACRIIRASSDVARPSPLTSWRGSGGRLEAHDLERNHGVCSRFLCELLKGEPLDRCGRIGNRVAVKCVEAVGARAGVKHVC